MGSVGKAARKVIIEGLRRAKRAEARAERVIKRRLGYDGPLEGERDSSAHPWESQDPGTPKIVDELAGAHCCGCGSCAQSCPKGAISMVRDEEGFYYPSVDHEACVNCGICVKRCPVLSGQPKNDPVTSCLATWSDRETRLESSSGGMFTVLARHVLSRGGVVFGAAYDEGLVVRHRMVDSEEGLAALRGSKYVQSQTGECYRQARELLEEGKPVLYTGCPCQVAGLCAFLGREYENLLTVDLICHGAPSPGLFERYLKETYDGLQTGVSFRDKRVFGWTASMSVRLADGAVADEAASRDPYMRMFSACLANRPFCSHCKFTRLPRVADLTIGDFWGIGGVDRELDDGNGTSVVLVNNARARAVMDELAPSLERVREFPLQTARARNGAIDGPLPAHPARERFFGLLRFQPFGKAVRYALAPRFDVGVFGLWYGENYGSILTYFGLVKVLESMGLSAALIANPLGSDRGDLLQPTAFARRQGFYITKRRPLSRMHECNAFCDAFMVGSDQLWNPALSGPYGHSYFLSFANPDKRRIAYGTSFGKGGLKVSPRYHERSRYELSRFDAISVRDDFSKQTLRDEYGVGSVKVLDPALLCDPVEYSKLAERANAATFLEGRDPDTSDGYLFAYMLDPNEGSLDALSELGERMGVPVVVALDMNPKLLQARQGLFSGGWRRGVYVLDEPTPEQWLRVLSESEAVLTDSFHGTLFSHVFQKRFVCLPNGMRGRERFSDVLGILGLEDRAVDGLDGNLDAVAGLLATPIDYAASNALLAVERENSRRWLEDAVFTSKCVSTDRAYARVEKKAVDSRG